MKLGDVLGIMAAVAVGVLGGILFAPEKGSKTRENILSKGEEYGDALKEKFDQVVTTVVDKYEDIKQDAEKLVANGMSKFNEAKKEVKNANT